MTPSTRKTSPHRSRHSHRRARYGETRLAGSEGGHTEKVLKRQEPRLVAYPTQESGGRLEASKAGYRKTRTIRLRLDCLKPNPQR
jgi:hypothetical protein